MPLPLLCDDGVRLAQGMAYALRGGLLSLRIERPVAAGQRLALTPSPDLTGPHFAVEGEVSACVETGAAAGGAWQVELQLEAPTPGDLELLGAALAAQSSSRK